MSESLTRPTIKKNPYLSQFKADVETKQRQIRERLSASNKSLTDSFKSKTDIDNIPTIDGEDVKQEYNSRPNLLKSSQDGNANTGNRSLSKSLRDEPIEQTELTGIDRLKDIAKKYDQRRSNMLSYKSSDLDDLPPKPKLNYDEHDYISNIQRRINNLPKSQRYRSPTADLESKTTEKVPQEHNKIKQSFIEKVYADEMDRQRASNLRTESPVKSESNYFSRKPSNSSLMRAHDSIRLKTGRKVGPQSDIVETDVGEEISKSHISERAVDVKRYDSKRYKKVDSQNFEQGSVESFPIRNFAEVRSVKIAIDGDSSLGATVKIEDGNIVVARVLSGGTVDSQQALHVGDIILAVNNCEVYTPEQLQEQLRKSINEKSVILKVVPSYKEDKAISCIYLRAFFSYDPNNDSLLPCKEVGVSFNQGDILEVVNQEDTNWWQARRVDSENLQTGLIPSQELEERRRAFIIPDYDLATKTSICGTRVSRVSKKKEIYNINQNSDFDKAEMPLYEEVCRTPAFERRTLVLISANGVGRQSLKATLISNHPDKFGTPLPYTSRAIRDDEEDGIHYHFDTREQMEEDIIAGKYLEYGEYEGALYGTKLESIREIIASGKMCILDCNASCLKILKSPDYLPFVVFIAAPTIDQLRYMHEWAQNGGANRTYATLDRAMSRQSRRARTLQDFAYDFFEDEDLQLSIEESARLFRIYENYFDLVLVNENLNQTYEHLKNAIDAISMAPQWIPISWIYGN